MSTSGWKRATLGLFALAFVAGSSIGCKSSAPPGANDGFDVLRLPNSIADGAHVADEKGFFAKHRIRIEWTGKQLHGPAGVVSVVAGQNDAAGSISTAIITAGAAAKP